MDLSPADFDYDLPPERIAQRPCEPRDAARMMVVDRHTGNALCGQFRDFPNYLNSGDCLVLNDTRVIPARLFGRKDSGGGAVEALLLDNRGPRRWAALLRPGRRLRPGTRVRLAEAEDLGFAVNQRLSDGIFEIEFSPAPDLEARLAAAGKMPLPPYIHRPSDAADRERYQTVYAAAAGAVAAPTAGLHFTPAMLEAVAARDVSVLTLTLHVGLGTFRPVEAEALADHRMHEERFVLPADTAGRINRCRERGGRVVAVGTTTVRVLESCVDAAGRVAPASGRTDIFLHPPYRPRAVDALLTNFHLPRSTLLMLVSTFAERDAILAAYRTAVAAGFRFYSYGDCMLLV